MKKLTDEKLDKLMEMLAAETALDDAAVNDIASSPQLWWSVQRGIADGKDAATAPWPPPKGWWRSLAFVGLPSLTAVLIVLALFSFRSKVEQSPIIVRSTEQPAIAQPVKVSSTPEIDSKATERQIHDVKAAGRNTSPRNLPAVTRSAVKPVKTVIASEEIKSEFIALTYAGNPESGQLVRVKVPSSMMVNLGLVDSVERPSRLVDAEVVVGDDGQTHAIRFIRPLGKLIGANMRTHVIH